MSKRVEGEGDYHMQLFRCGCFHLYIHVEGCACVIEFVGHDLRNMLNRFIIETKVGNVEIERW